MRLIRVMCSGRVDLEFILRAFMNGQDGVFIGGCKLDECNYITQGNYDALSTVYIARKIMEHLGLNPMRLRVEFISSSDGNLLAELTDDFCSQIKEIGPLGKSEGFDAKELELKLKAVNKLVPYIKLVERERLRQPVKSKAAYDEFFTSSELDELFNELIAEKMSLSQIMLLLQESPLTTGEISKMLGLSPSEVAKYMGSSSRQGLVRYDESNNCYALV
jgi:coenzyme F420-reducing hydrogenase delta subunit